MRIVPRVSDLVCQIAPDYRSAAEAIDCREIARWGRWLGLADGASGGTAHLDAFHASSIYARLAPRTRRLFAYSYMHATREADATRV